MTDKTLKEKFIEILKFNMLEPTIDPEDGNFEDHRSIQLWKFLTNELAKAKEEGTREERELIVKLQMIRLGIQVFNKSEQERDEEEKRGLVRRDGGRTMSAFSLIKQIDIEIKKLTKKD